MLCMKDQNASKVKWKVAKEKEKRPSVVVQLFV